LTQEGVLERPFRERDNDQPQQRREGRQFQENNRRREKKELKARQTRPGKLMRILGRGKWDNSKKEGIT